MRYRTSQKRPGTVTVVVVAFLALLLIMGLSFAFYALRESEESRVFRDSVNGGATGVFPTSRTSSGIDDPPEPDTIFNRVAGDIIYGPPDDLTGAFNVLRQHEMARSIYGWNPKFPSPYWPYDPTAVPPPPGFVPVAIPGIGAAAVDTANRAALQPFNGLGRVSPTV
ncbi:MAG: hypothetical protein J2P46_19590, partial [Zavarzinella sp.]|nr:hypothetical protein [Zavarzinella sp.]